MTEPPEEGQIPGLTLAPADRGRLADALAEAQRRGLLGPGSIEAQIDHALAVGSAVAGVLGAAGGAGGAGEAASGEPALVRCVDLGTGGGLPGLVLACALPRSQWMLLDSRSRSIECVRDAVVRMGLEDRVTALLGRAEEVGRDPVHRGRYTVVVARGFGPPAVTAECGAPLLRLGGHLIVTEPPGGDATRWPAAGLLQLGLRLRRSDLHQRASVAVLELAEPVPETYPRRVGLPAKRPLFSVSRETETGT